jgi:hypothetical protein
MAASCAIVIPTTVAADDFKQRIRRFLAQPFGVEREREIEIGLQVVGIEVDAISQFVDLAEILGLLGVLKRAPPPRRRARRRLRKASKSARPHRSARVDVKAQRRLPGVGGSPWRVRRQRLRASEIAVRNHACALRAHRPRLDGPSRSRKP